MVNCDSVADAHTMLLPRTLYSFFFLFSSYFSFPPKFELASSLWKRARSNRNFNNNNNNNIIIIIKAICNAQDALKKAANALSGLIEWSQFVVDNFIG